MDRCVVIFVVVGMEGEEFFVEKVDLFLECCEDGGCCFDFELNLVEGSMIRCKLECDGRVYGLSVGGLD